ncbi:hypothetical protein A3C87_00580 [Candidatus Kaiserbacteria bacterium RIFCSPHIGHO2_02_FULL_49_34]|uniref:Uncharacterized protein n=1 Tax=Candidatus Kaiserbacteria bacterium RIFCSPHIGHO2_02_FULL_49_34 TaxID=1798491 RepID=A0A1F6DKB9_9BACT|nr:MAG: hypothetical protein A3C87_00580 [Candidatus Kaiserbacteria bacterium RIFCSPHIGHO2_02_FULL_49_34]
MGTQRESLGRVVVVKPYRKHGNGAVGSGRQQSTGKRVFVYQVHEGGKRELLRSSEGPTLAAAMKPLRSAKLVPTWVDVKNKGETYF